MMDKQKIILQAITKGPKTFECLFALVGNSDRMTRDGLESVLNSMKAKKKVTPVDGRWMLYVKPPKHAVTETEINGGLVHGW